MKCYLKIDDDFSFTFYDEKFDEENDDITKCCYFLHQEFSDVIKLQLYPSDTILPHIIHGYETIDRRMKMKRVKVD